jgi:hypothetical protein
MTEQQVALHASVVAAQIRCLHPCSMGNLELSVLITNHIRQVHGLPWTAETMSAHAFKAVRTLYRLHNCECY